MIIPVKKPYTVTIQEDQTNWEYKETYILQAELLIYAENIEDACQRARNYFGMGVKVDVIKCERG